MLSLRKKVSPVLELPLSNMNVDSDHASNQIAVHCLEALMASSLRIKTDAAVPVSFRFVG